MKRHVEKDANFISYDEKGTEQVSEQIMDSYNSGVIEDAQSINPIQAAHNHPRK